MTKKATIKAKVGAANSEVSLELTREEARTIISERAKVAAIPSVIPREAVWQFINQASRRLSHIVALNEMLLDGDVESDFHRELIFGCTLDLLNSIVTDLHESGQDLQKNGELMDLSIASGNGVLNSNCDAIFAERDRMLAECGLGQ